MSDYPSLPTKLLPGGGSSGTPGATPGSPSSSGGSAGSSPFNRTAFIKSYAGMVARTWADDQYLELILADPATTLSKAGLDTTPGAVIRIIQLKMTGMGKMEEQVDLWLKGIQTGLYDIYLPMRPDDVDLSGGMMSDDGNCCCCTPCCCCT